MSAPAHPITTAEELLAASTDMGRCELVRGELIMMTPGKGRHAAIGARIARALVNFADASGLVLGFVLADADVDAAWETLAASNDPAVHLEQVKVVEKELWDTLYGIPIFAHPGVVGYDSSLENVRHTSVQTGVSWNAEQWVRAN